MIKVVLVTDRIDETILILRSLKRYFLNPSKNNSYLLGGNAIFGTDSRKVLVDSKTKVF